MNYQSWYAPILMRANKGFAAYIRSSRWLTYRIFGIRVNPAKRPQYWDYTSIVLRKALLKNAVAGHATLEIGPGENAILSQFASRQCKTRSVAVELDRQAIETARLSCTRNGNSVRLLEGDMFQPVEGEFDLIFWNPPYVPADADEKGLVGEQAAIETDGGEQGLELISRFLADASDYLALGGQVLLGFSKFYVDSERVQSIALKNDLRFVSEVSCFLNPSIVFVFSLE